MNDKLNKIYISILENLNIKEGEVENVKTKEITGSKYLMKFILDNIYEIDIRCNIDLVIASIYIVIAEDKIKWNCSDWIKIKVLTKKFDDEITKLLQKILLYTLNYKYSIRGWKL